MTVYDGPQAGSAQAAGLAARRFRVSVRAAWGARGAVYPPAGHGPPTIRRCYGTRGRRSGFPAAAANPGTQGQPNQSCEDQPSTPGNAASAPGSAFNPDGQAGTVYAGEQPQNSVNPNAVSQYDVACFQVSQP